MPNASYLLETSDKQWKNVYLTGGITTIIVLCGILLDMIVGSVTGGSIDALPQTAVERFSQFRENRLLGLYNLDLLNVINQLIMIPSVFALYAVHRKSVNANALLAMILFLTGTTLYAAGNTALTMLDLSKEYYAADTDLQKNLIAAAGEAMLIKGRHGGLGVFFGFALPTFGNILMSWVMFKGNIFNKTTSVTGFVGNMLMLIYIILVTFIPSVEKLTLAFALPGGLLVMAWMILFTVKLFRLSSAEN